MKTNANKKKAVRASAIKEYFAEQPWIVPSLVFIAILAVVVTLSLTVPHNKQAVVTAVGQDCVIVAYQNNAINSPVPFILKLILFKATVYTFFLEVG